MRYFASAVLTIAAFSALLLWTLDSSEKRSARAIGESGFSDGEIAAAREAEVQFSAKIAESRPVGEEWLAGREELEGTVAGHSIQIVVEDEFGVPCEGVAIQVSPSDSQARLNCSCNGKRVVGRTGPDGILQIDGLQEGSWAAVGLAERDWFASEVVRVEVPHLADIPTRIELPFGEPWDYASGVLVSLDDAFVPDDCILVPADDQKRIYLVPPSGEFWLKEMAGTYREFLVLDNSALPPKLIGKFTIQGGDRDARVAL